MNKLLLVLMLVWWPTWVLAQEIPEAVRKAAADLAGDGERVGISPAAMPGLYEVIIGPYVVYLSADGNYLMRGEMIDLQTRRNLTAAVRNHARAGVIDAIDVSGMIVFSADKPKHVVTVFTDVDCGYCAKLHREMNQYLAEGISVRYIAFPRAGIPSSSYETMVSVWCADDPRKTIGDAKARRPVPPKKCPNPVAEHYETGRLLGVRGTPTIVMETGDVVPGYMPAKKLSEAIVESKANSS